MYDDFDYIINTQVASSRILNGMGETYLNNASVPLEEVASPSEWEEIFSELKEIINDENHALRLYWTVLD